MTGEARCWECEHLKSDHHHHEGEAGYCQKGECQCAEYSEYEVEATGCEYGCAYGTDEHEARLMQLERTGQW